jgi:hypothetical protein
MTSKSADAPRLAICAALALAACAQGDWRAQTIAGAEAQMRTEVSDPAAKFWRVQVTGDDKTGQTCGYVTKNSGPESSGGTQRFIVYIDQTAGPFVEGSLGKTSMAPGAFDRAWQADCVNEGYNS